MKKPLALLLLFIGSLFVLPVNGQQIEKPDTTVINVEIPPMNIAVNPVKEILDTFLPDTIGPYKSITEIRNDITYELTGCFKTYQRIDDSLVSINISISKGKLIFLNETKQSRTESKLTVKGNTAKLTQRMGGNSFLLQIESYGKIVSLSGKVDQNTLIDFGEKLPYDLIKEL